MCGGRRQGVTRKGSKRDMRLDARGERERSDVVVVKLDALAELRERGRLSERKWKNAPVDALCHGWI